MDFITGLPELSGFTRVWVIINRFTKMAHFISLKTKATIEVLTYRYIQEVWRLHGLQSEIVSDRDTRFDNKF
jgi:hypothetical protein